MPVRAAVLVPLDEDLVAACDQKARRRVAREIVVQCQVLAAPEPPGDARLSAPNEARRLGRLVNEPATEDLVEMAEGADLSPSAPERRGVPFRVAHARTEVVGLGATRGEAGRLFGGDQRIAHWRRR